MLSDRAATSLNVLVDEYLQSATPVASDESARSLGQKISFATARKTMPRLTDGGYISWPHVSSGGVLSYSCYGYYVEFLPETPRRPTGLQETFERDLTQTEPDIGTWSKRCSAFMTDLEENLAIVTVPRAQSSRLKLIQLAFLQESAALLVLVLEEARLLRKTLPFRDRVNHDQLDRATNRLKGSLTGLNGSQMQSSNLNLNLPEDDVKSGSVSLMQGVETGEDQEHYTDGLPMLVNQPEFPEDELVRNLPQLVDEKVLLERVLNRGTESASLAVVIGSENPDEVLNPLVVIICQYGGPQEVSGIICVNALKRIGYVAALGGVRHLWDSMSQMVDGIQTVALIDC